MKILKRFFFGLLIGLGKVIPGVSGSLIAISLGVYEPAIYCFCNFFHNVKKNFIYLCPLFLGVIISIIFSSKIVINLLNNYYVSTIFLFLGIICGSIQDIRKHTNKKYTYLTILSFILVLFISSNIIQLHTLVNDSSYQFLFYIFIGFIDAMCMIIPGLSGTAILMMFGCYEMLMTVLSNLTNIKQIIDNFLILLPFGIGLLIGILIFTRLVKILFEKYYIKTYNIILGFMLSSILYMFKSTLKYRLSISELFLSYSLFLVGYIVIKKINRFNDD